MKPERRIVLTGLLGTAGTLIIGGRIAAAGTDGLKLQKSPAEWQRLLEPEAYRVLFEEDTEMPGSSPLNAEKRAGTFVCAACNQPLFESETKYESGTGWPSFWRPIEGSVRTRQDRKLFLVRTEYHCSRCGGHQGHLFGDGPEPTGRRYCNNGVALRFVPQGEPMPELRQ